MRFGACRPIADAQKLYAFGFDYFEVGASSLAAMTDEEFAAFCAENAAAPIHAETANGLFPGSVRLTGDVDWEQVEAYIDKVMSRLGAAGIQIAVFGSSGSRNVPEGFDRDTAWQQLIKVGGMLGEAAEKYGVTVALEPLRKKETNIINAQLEGLKLVNEVGHPHFKLLCDYFHLMQVGGGTVEDVRACGDALAHVHIAKPDDRKAMYPGDGADYKAFFDALRSINYDARISFEGDAGDFEKSMPLLLEVLKHS